MTRPLDRTAFYIDGTWTEPESSVEIDVFNPYTEEVVGRVAKASQADIDKAVAAARVAFDRGEWRFATPDDRATVLRRTADILEQRSDEIRELAISELGCTRHYAESMQLTSPAAALRSYAEIITSFCWREERSDGRNRSQIVQHPVGVVGAVTPWNGPMTNPTGKVAPAIASGCSLVVKPSPLTPLTGFILMEALEKAGLPPGVVNYVPGYDDAGRWLVAHPKVDKVAFTGSTAAGRDIMASCATRIARVTLELGGKSAAIMLESADISSYVHGVIARSITLNNGQTCGSLTRLLVPRSRYPETVDAFSEAVRSLRVGDPFSSETDVGPLVSPEQRDRVEQYIDLGRNGEGRLTTGGGRPVDQPQGWFVEPTVFVDVDNAARIAQEEIFGPVAVVIPYDRTEDAVALANDSVYGLFGAVWSGDDSEAFDVAVQLDAGTVFVNDHPQAASTPFGGFKQSGIGREWGVEGLLEYLELQRVSIKPN